MAGVSDSKFFVKMASDQRNPHGLFIVDLFTAEAAHAAIEPLVVKVCSYFEG